MDGALSPEASVDDVRHSREAEKLELRALNGRLQAYGV